MTAPGREEAELGLWFSQEDPLEKPLLRGH